MALVVDVLVVVVAPEVRALEVVVVALEAKVLEVKVAPLEVKGTLAITQAMYQPLPLKILGSSQP